MKELLMKALLMTSLRPLLLLNCVNITKPLNF